MEPSLNTAAASRPSVAPSLAPPDTQSAPARAISILIVDDDPINHELTGSILQDAGYNVSCVASGAKAIEAVKTTDFDIVLMDVRMPVMDGLEATRHIRALDGRRGQVPIVALTGMDFPKQIEACRKAGMNGHVSKSLDPDDLVAAVARATRNTAAQGNPREPGCVTVSTADTKIRRIGTDLRVIDLETFKRTAAFLTPKALAAYLRKIAALANDLLVMLDGPEVPEWNENEFAGAAHVVAGTAGMLGFERLTVASQEFERAAKCGTSQAPPLAEALSSAIKETLPEIHNQMAAADG